MEKWRSATGGFFGGAAMLACWLFSTRPGWSTVDQRKRRERGEDGGFTGGGKNGGEGVWTKIGQRGVDGWCAGEMTGAVTAVTGRMRGRREWFWEVMSWKLRRNKSGPPKKRLLAEVGLRGRGGKGDGVVVNGKNDERGRKLLRR
ncbi:hypothetical protein HAX54_014866 [Datura stramonium]|uniref:Uncharacterized protein n=1 Tax=Datura stramonium TaxID=4076 RepID=A0ABS8TQR1_DATST|nr:hypothetical protein [Datura stramonium]